MGTRSLTIVIDDNQEICRIYRQMDGVPKWHGVELAQLCNKRIVNGIGPGDRDGAANGMGCLAAQIIAGLKDGIGGIYLEPAGGEIGDWVEYVYIVRPPAKLGGKPVIECSTQTGPFPFNAQEEARFVFRLSPAEVIARYARDAA